MTRTVIVIILAILLIMASGALSVAISGCAFLDLGFWDSWHAAWNRPGFLFLFAVLTKGSRSVGNRS